MSTATPIHLKRATAEESLADDLRPPHPVRRPRRPRTPNARPEPVSNTLTLAVAAGRDATRRAVDRLDLAGPAIAAMHATGMGDRVSVRPGGFIWRPGDAPGHVEARVAVRVEPGSEDGSLLSITTQFRATDETTRARMLDAWPLVGPLAHALALHVARRVKTYAEDDRFEADVDVRGEAQAA